MTDDQMVTVFMKRLHAEPVNTLPGLPAADVLWLKAQLIQRWNAERKVRLPLHVMEPFEIAASAIAAMLLLFWSVPSAFEWLPRVF
jgi:hypothetical protein